MVTKMNIALVLMTILAALPRNIVAVDHIVGGTTGWTIPSGGPTTYANWASGRTFRVGDTLGMYIITYLIPFLLYMVRMI